MNRTKHTLHYAPEGNRHFDYYFFANQFSEQIIYNTLEVQHICIWIKFQPKISNKNQ